MLFRKLLMSRVTAERRSGLWGVTQLLALHLRTGLGSLRPAREEHSKLIGMLKPAFAFPYALRLELYTTLTELISDTPVVRTVLCWHWADVSTQTLHAEAAGQLQGSCALPLSISLCTRSQ